MSAIRQKFGFGKSKSKAVPNPQDENIPPLMSSAGSFSQGQHQVYPMAPPPLPARQSQSEQPRASHDARLGRRDSQRSHLSGLQALPPVPTSQSGPPPASPDRSTPESRVKSAITLFCSTADDSDVIHLPTIVENVSASPAAAKVAVDQISKFFKSSLLHGNHNALVLLGTLVAHPGQQFTRLIDASSLTSNLRSLLKTSGDYRVLTRAQQTLDSFLMSHDIHLYQLRKMWLKERHEIDKAAIRTTGASQLIRMTPSQIFELGQQSVLGQGNIQIKSPAINSRQSQDGGNRRQQQQQQNQHPPLPPPRSHNPPIWQPSPELLTREINGADAAAEMLSDMYSNPNMSILDNSNKNGSSTEGQSDGLSDITTGLVDQCTLAIQRLSPLLTAANTQAGSDINNPNNTLNRSQMTEVVLVIDKINKALSLRNQVMLRQLLGNDADNNLGVNHGNGSNNFRRPSRDSSRPSLTISRRQSIDGGAGQSRSSSFGNTSSATAGPSQPTAGDVQLQQQIQKAIYTADLNDGHGAGNSNVHALALGQQQIPIPTQPRPSGRKGKERMQPIGMGEQMSTSSAMSAMSGVGSDGGSVPIGAGMGDANGYAQGSLSPPYRAAAPPS